MVTPADRLVFPVQSVNRPNAQFRGYSGCVAEGSVRVGDEIRVTGWCREAEESKLTPGQRLAANAKKSIEIVRATSPKARIAGSIRSIVAASSVPATARLPINGTP